MVSTSCSRPVTVTMSSSKTFTKAVTEAGVRTVDITGTSASTNTTAVASSPMEWDQQGQIFPHLLLFYSSRSRLRSDRRNKVWNNGGTVGRVVGVNLKLGYILGSERKIVCGFNLVSELFQSFCRCLVSQMTIASSLIGQYTLRFWFLQCKRSLEFWEMVIKFIQ